MELKAFTNSSAFVLGIFLLGPMLGMVVFAIKNRFHPLVISARVKKSGGSALVNAWVMEYGYWWLRPQARLLVALGLTPTAITLLGLALTSVGCVLVGYGYFGLGGLIILGAALFDLLDGMVARMTGTSSNSGEFVDAVADRYADAALCGGLFAYYLQTPLFAWLTASAALGSFMVSYIRCKAESFGLWRVPTGLMQRTERCVYLGFSIMLAPAVATVTEGHTLHPQYYLAAGAVGCVACLTHASALRMVLYIAQHMRQSERDAQLSRPDDQTQAA